jgi:cyclic pyranopterin phosphate synthase
MLTDAFGRGVTDIRISLTNRCNFSCVYCHDEGLGPVAQPGAPHGEEMLPVEVDRIVGVAREFGIRSVKFTGGEPLVRLDLEQIVERTVRQIPDVSLTTNGSMLPQRAAGLRAAGLKRVNVSVDSLDPKEFREIRHGSLEAVLRGVRSALSAGLTPVKLNMVLFSLTTENVPGLIDFVRETPGLKLQLIQFMPEFAAHPEWRANVRNVREWLDRRATQVLVREMHHRRIYLFDGAEVELVDPVDNPEFCLNCHRIRVTHKGELKGCLNRNDDLVPTRGLNDAQMRAAFRRVITQRVPYYGVYRVPAADAGWTELPVIRSVPTTRAD